MMKRLLLSIFWSVITMVTPVIVFAHPGHNNEEQIHSFLHFEHLFIALAIILFIVINSVLKKFIKPVLNERLQKKKQKIEKRGV